ncbi:uncharacterized protein [Asterias amurensis]|uniref:uncharacterized protein n=1 Tax=Asterias amurensis TaxID=7602 RepID=UPI003AB4BFF1
MYISPSASISLQFNLITNVKVLFNGGQNCNITLELDNNVIRHFDYDNDFGNTKLFHKLSLSHNQVQSISSSNGMLITSIFNIESNELRDWDVLADALRYGFPYVESLSIRGNSLDSLIQAPSWTEELQVLNADGNSLKNLSSESIQGFLSLTELHVSNNQILFISESAFRELKMLRYLYLDGNPLTSLFGGVFRSQGDLLILSLANCNLNELHPEYFLGLDSLERLDLSENQLVQLHSEMFRLLPQIVTMNFSNNNIKNFDLEDCQLVDGLKILLLARNSISDISSILGHCGHLETVDLSSNHIEIVPGDSIVGISPTLSRLDLFGNPLQCDCRMASIRDWLQNNPPPSTPLCHGPQGLEGRALIDLATHDLACEPPLAVLGFKMLQTVAGGTVTLPCKSTGIPAPSTSWLSPNGTVIDGNLKGKYFITQEMTLHIIKVEKSDQGLFTCRVMNELGETDEAVIHLTVAEEPGSPASPSSYILPTMFLTVLFTLLAVVLAYFLRKPLEKRSQTITTSKAKIDCRKSRVDSVDSSRYVNSVIDDGEVEPGGDEGDRYEDHEGDGYEDHEGDGYEDHEGDGYEDTASFNEDCPSSAYDNTVSLSERGDCDDYEAVEIGSVS